MTKPVKRKQREAAPAPPAEEAPIEPGATAVAGFQFCTLQEVERLMRILEGGALMQGVSIAAGARVALAAQQFRLAIDAFRTGSSAGQADHVNHFVMAKFAELLNWTLGNGALRFVVVEERPPSAGPH